MSLGVDPGKLLARHKGYLVPHVQDRFEHFKNLSGESGALCSAKAAATCPTLVARVSACMLYMSRAEPLHMKQHQQANRVCPLAPPHKTRDIAISLLPSVTCSAALPALFHNAETCGHNGL